jgi:hypothetical protein
MLNTSAGIDTFEAGSLGFLFDRRRSTRYPATSTATAVRGGAEATMTRQLSVSLDVDNISAGGLAAHSPVVFKKGERITVHFGSHGGEAGMEMAGVVVRCEAREVGPTGGYDVAIRFEAMAAAA